MKNFFVTVILIIWGLSFVFVAIRFTKEGDAAPQAEDDEIKVNIQFDLGEDIGLFLVDYDVEGNQGKGGISNADKSMLKRDQTDLFWSFDKEHFGNSVNTVDVTIQFTVVTQYFNPNYDNIYPDAYTIPAGTVSFTAQFGEIYYVMITGNRDDGYQATFQNN